MDMERCQRYIVKGEKASHRIHRLLTHLSFKKIKKEMRENDKMSENKEKQQEYEHLYTYVEKSIF